MRYEYVISCLQEQLDFYDWCIKTKIKSKKGMVKEIKELKSAIKLLQESEEK